MIIEVHGTGTRNKGAELMLDAIVAQLGDRHRITVEATSGLDYDARVRRRLLLKVGHRNVREGVVARGERLIPAAGRQSLSANLGLSFVSDVDAVLDASGFAYSDQWGPKLARAAAAKHRYAHAVGRPVILMPQALGPFKSRPVRNAFRRIAESADLVFARDQGSWEYALEAGCTEQCLRLAPDFTGSIDPVKPDRDLGSRLAVVVPSGTLLSRGGPRLTSAYLPFLAEVVDRLRRSGYDVALMVHETGDVETAARLQASLPEPAPVYGGASAAELKGILGAARLVVGSRFHALVGSLSQAVPSLGIGWSHKYEALFEGFDCPEMLVDPSDGVARVGELLAALDRGTEREHLVARLRAAAGSQREATVAMWSEIASVLAGHPLSAWSSSPPGPPRLRGVTQSLP